MSIRKQPFISKEYYHVHNRGNSKQTIFHDQSDYKRFVSLLYACNSKNNFKINDLDKDKSPYDFKRGHLLVNIGAYCLMPNHFHILITQTENGDISKFMQKLTTAYVMYYNKKYIRTGSLFEGKYKATHANNDPYLKYLFSYIHLNPVKLIDMNWKENGVRNKKEALDHLNSYNPSSYLDYLGMTRVENTILNIETFPNYFHTKEMFLEEIFEWLNFQKHFQLSP